jgi:5-methylcytosine-specific restriction endonuclease McrA
VAARKKISKAVRRRVYARDDWTCRYCGLQFDAANTWNPDSVAPYVVDPIRGPIFLEIDHVHPLHHGGTNDEANLCAACTPCNRAKSFHPLQLEGGTAP